MAIAGVVGLLLPMVRKVLPEAQRGLVPSGLAMGIAFIVPAYYSVAIFLGCAVFGIWKRRSPEQHAACFRGGLRRGRWRRLDEHSESRAFLPRSL